MEENRENDVHEHYSMQDDFYIPMADEIRDIAWRLVAVFTLNVLFKLKKKFTIFILLFTF